MSACVCGRRSQERGNRHVLQPQDPAGGVSIRGVSAHACTPATQNAFPPEIRQEQHPRLAVGLWDSLAANVATSADMTYPAPDTTRIGGSSAGHSSYGMYHWLCSCVGRGRGSRGERRTCLSKRRESPPGCRSAATPGGARASAAQRAALGRALLSRWGLNSPMSYPQKYPRRGASRSSASSRRMYT